MFGALGRLAGGLMVGVAACRTDSPSAPIRGVIDVSGTWASSDTVAGFDGFRLDLSERGSGAITGRWMVPGTVPAAGDSLRSGPASGGFTDPTMLHISLSGFFGFDLYGTIEVSGADTSMLAEFRSPDFVIAENGEHFSMRLRKR